MKYLALALLLALAAFAAAPAPEEFSSSGGPIQITPIQHASLMIKAGGKVIYVDPAQGSFDGLPQADYILITHTHGDHLVPAIIEKLKKPTTVIIAPKAVAATVAGATVLNNGETKAIGDFKIEALPMYNLTAERAQFHPKGAGNGYVLNYGGKRIYIAGDTEGIPEMKALKNIDIAFIPMNLPFTMTPQEAAEAVRAFHPAVVYPYHYSNSDLQVFAKALEGTGIDVRLRDWYAK
jgi:L-ascorbate metabolism protein UlaG (beta-lactamase superfamily)